MANVSNLILPDATPIVLKDNSQSKSDHRHYSSDVVPIIHKLYESTSYYATAANQGASTWYVASVKPDSWYLPWKIKFKFHTYCPNYPAYESVTYSMITGRSTGISYANWNEIQTTAHYYINVYPLTAAGFNAGYGFAIGVCIYAATDYTKAAYYRSFEVDFLESENCTVTMLDTPVKWADWPGTGTTNYGSLVSTNGCTRGLQETGDNNDTLHSKIAYFSGKTGTKGIWAASIFMEDGNGTFQNVATASDGTVTTANRTASTTKLANTNGFKVGSSIWYPNTSYNANTNISGSSVVYSAYGLVDTRYVFNTTLTANCLTPYKLIYLVGTINPIDNLFYLDQDVWWTQTPDDTTKVYVLVGGVYDSTTSNCRMQLYEQNKWYRYDGTNLVELTYGATTLVSKGSMIPITDNAPYLLRQSGGDNNAYVGTEETDKLVGASAVVNQAVNPNGGTQDKTVSGSIVSITDAIASSVIDLKANVVATETGTGAKSPSNPYVIGGHTGLNINAVDFNQLVNNGNFVDKSNWTENGATWSVADNVATVTPMEFRGYLRQGINVQANHIYLRFCNFKGENGAAYSFNGLFANVYGTGNWQSLSLIRKETTGGTRYYQFRSEETSNFHNFYIKNVIYFDLTQMFGSTIADYLYALEQGQEGAGVAVFKRMFYKDYYAYTTGGTVQYIKDINGDNYPYAHADFGQTVYGGEFVAKEGEFDKVTVNSDVIDMGNLTWYYRSANQCFYADVPNRKKYVDSSNYGLVSSEIYLWGGNKGLSSTLTDGYIYGCNAVDSIMVLVCDTAYTDAQTFTNAVTGKKLWFEVETPSEITLPTKTQVNLLANQVNTIFADSGDIELTYKAPITEVPTISGHKYYTRINGTTTIQASTGTAISINDRTEDNVSDLTAMFGTAIADYAYSLENATAGSGIAWLNKYGFFTKSYYPYQANALQSVKTSAHIMRDSSDNIIGNYALPNVDLRGLYKLDSGNNIYADGDTLESDGTITRKYQQRAYESGDESLVNAITDGTNTVVALTTPITEESTPFTNPQIVDKNGTEEYADNRDFPMPVGHETEYIKNIYGDREKLDSLPNSTSTNGTYAISQTAGKMSLVSTSEISVGDAETVDGYTISTTSIGSATVGTAFTLPKTFSTTDIPNISKKTVVTSASGATAAYANGILTFTNGSFETGDSVTVGTPIAAYTGISTTETIPNISVETKTVATATRDES